MEANRRHQQPAQNLSVERRLGDVQIPGLELIVVGLALITSAAFVYMTRYLIFYRNEWDLVATSRAWNPNIWMVPVDSSWSIAPTLVWKVLFITVGIRSHVPYEAVLLAAHMASVFLLFFLVRQHSGDLLAFASALILLVLGSGGTDILWAYQLGYVMSVAFGLLGMWLLTPSHSNSIRMALTSVAFLCSLGSSSVGIAFWAATLVQVLFDHRQKRVLLALVLPGAAAAPWLSIYVPLLHSGLDVMSLAGFVMWGLEACAAAASGLPLIGATLLPLFALLIGLHWYREGMEGWQLSSSVGILVWFVLAGLGLAQTGPSAAGDSRFVYVGVVFLLPLLADSLRPFPWRPRWVIAVAVVVTIGLIGNAVELLALAGSQTQTMLTEKAELQTLLAFRRAPDIALDHSVDEQLMPHLTASRFVAATQDLGSPVEAIGMTELGRLPPQAVDTAMVNLFGGALTFASYPDRPIQGLQCVSIDLSQGSELDLRATEGQSVMFKSSQGGLAFLFLGYMTQPASNPLLQVDLAPGTQEWLHLPDTGTQLIWRLQLRTIPQGNLQICGSSDLKLNQTVSRLYAANAATGTADRGWSVLDDSAAFAGSAAVAAGNFKSSQNDVFGTAAVPMGGAYDVWFRVRVASSKPATAEMTLGLWDDQAEKWVGSTRYPPDQFGSTYSWVRVASSVTPTTGHSVHFIASFIRQLSTEWYIDEAVMLPPASSFPDRTAA